MKILKIVWPVIEASLLMIFFIYPFSKYRINIPSFLFFLFGLVFLTFRKLKLEDIKSSITQNWFLVWPFFITIIFSLFHLEQFNIDFIILNIPFLLFPLLIFLNKDYFSNNFFQKLMWTGVIAVLLFMSYRLFLGFQFYLDSGSTDRLFYNQLLKNTTTHPTYLSLFINFLLFTLVHHYYLLKDKFTISKIWILLPISALIACIFFVASRIGILFFVAFVCILLLYILAKKLNLIASIIAVILFSILVYSTINTYFPRVSKRFEKLQPKNLGKFESRQIIWGSSVDLIKQQAFIGYGNPPNLKEHLQQSYRALNFDKGEKMAYNAHNQYLEYFLLYGLLGGVFYISSLLKLLNLFVKSRNFHLFLVVSLLLVYSISETILETQNGIVFFTMTLSLVLFLNKSNLKPC